MITGSLLGTIAAGAALGAATSAGVTAIRGGSWKDSLKAALIGSGTGAATAGIGSAFSSVASSAINAMGSGLSKAGTAVSQIGTEGSKLSTITNAASKGLLNIGSKLSSVGKTGVPTSDMIPETSTSIPTGSASALPKESINNTLNGKQIATATTGNSPTATSNIATTNVVKATQTNQVSNAVQVQNPTSANTKGLVQIGYKGTLPSVGGMSPKPQFVESSVVNATNASGNKVITGLKNVGKAVAMQGGVQGALSLISAIGSVKTASQANKIQQQSLLFQQQTYNEQKEKQDAKEARLKSEAWNAYSSASIFGENLYKQGTNSQLFTTDYKENPTGNYSILSGNSGSFSNSSLITNYKDYV